jgi:hypothetical protein
MLDYPTHGDDESYWDESYWLDEKIIAVPWWRVI